MNVKKADLVIIGGGPAGMAAAIEASKNGIRDILILERENNLGGILHQCIHNGFGLHYFGEELTGPEYAWRFIDEVHARNISYYVETTVINFGPDKTITAINSQEGLFIIKPRAVVLAMGCRERTRGALNIPGTRPAGIYTAGLAQKFVNMEGFMPGKSVVILGSGDIGLIMARRMFLEGAQVKMVCELMPYSGGLNRNIVHCLEDFDIPLRLKHTVVAIHGKERLEGVTIAQVDEHRKPIMETCETVTCDTLLLSVGLIPENELTREAGIIVDRRTSGPVVNDCMETSMEGVFACGNVVHVHDLVDYVSREGARAGECAAAYITAEGDKAEGGEIQITAGKCVRYTVPQKIVPKGQKNIRLFFRVTDIFRKVKIVVKANGETVFERKRNKVTPGEMESLEIPGSILNSPTNVNELLVEVQNIEEGQ